MAYVPVPKDLTKVKTKVALNLTKSSVKSDKTAADFLFTCRSSGNSVLSVHEKTNRFQYRSHPDGNDHASIFLHGNV